MKQEVEALPLERDGTAQTSMQDASLLTDIANLQLEQGNVAEAKATFERVADIRAKDLQEEVDKVNAAGSEEWEEEDDWETLLERNPSTEDKDDSFWKSRQTKKPTPSSPASPPGMQHRGRGSVVYQREREGETQNGSAGFSGRSKGSGGSLAMDNIDHKTGRGWSAADFQHVMEIYDLNSSIREIDVHDVLRSFWWQNVRPNLQWVDETRVLVVFPCSDAAEDFLLSSAHRYRVRRFNPNAFVDINEYDLTPARHRPATTTAIARRLLSHHLARPELRDHDAEQRLRKQRQQNREARRIRQTAVDAAWDD